MKSKISSRDLKPTCLQILRDFGDIKFFWGLQDSKLLGLQNLEKLKYLDFGLGDFGNEVKISTMDLKPTGLQILIDLRHKIFLGSAEFKASGVCKI